jgi:glucosamine--fructose-6-phosphate aminotransferase (isomerizing)
VARASLNQLRPTQRPLTGELSLPYHAAMDDLRASLGSFDPDARLPGAPDPWEYLPMPDLRAGPPWAMAEMIAAEPALAARIVARLVADGSAGALAGAIRDAAAAGLPVVLTGCGTSEHAAMAAAAILRDGWRAAGLPGLGPISAQSFELSLDSPQRGLVIGVSHEGGTAATIAALAAARAAGARTALITGSAAAPASDSADTILATVELDGSWCHTVGYVSPMVAALATTGFLAGGTPNPERPAARLREGIEAAHAAGSDGTRPDERIGDAIAAASHLLVIASGVDRVTARELVLKVEEAAHLPSAVRDLETFLHGHLPATGPGTALVLVLLERGAPEERARRARQALAAAAATGMRPAAILGADAAAMVPGVLTPGGRIVVPEHPTMPNAPAALLGAAGPLQLVTLAIAHARGTNPDAIRRDQPDYLRAAELADAPEG